MKITKESSMQEVLEAYPSSQRALFQRYHIGGCHSCGYDPSEKLQDVVAARGITDIDSVLKFIEEAEEADKRVQVSVEEASKLLKGAKAPRLYDVRMKAEHELAHIEGDILVNEDVVREIMSSPQDTPMIFYCHTGQRSLDAASYFAGHGFMNARSLTGGVDAWARQVDPSVPRYEIARDQTTGRPVFRPLREVVSQAEGCVSPKPAH
jgi:rhodanese-related sulfurtransferase